MALFVNDQLLHHSTGRNLRIACGTAIPIEREGPWVQVRMPLLMTLAYQLQRLTHALHVCHQTWRGHPLHVCKLNLS